MSTRFNDGSHYENHQRAAELHDAAAHAHRAGEQHADRDHLTGHEQSKLAMEHSREAHEHSLATGNGQAASFGHQEIAVLAQELWRARGCPEGSPQEDWSQAVKVLRERAASGRKHA
jgi:hypothetical protein